MNKNNKLFGLYGIQSMIANSSENNEQLNQHNPEDRLSIAYSKAYSKLSEIIDKYIDLNLSISTMNKFLSDVINYESYDLYFYLNDRSLARTTVNSALDRLSKDRDCFLFWDYYSCYLYGCPYKALERFVYNK